MLFSCLLCIIFYLTAGFSTERITYMDLERPIVLYMNNSYIKYLNFNCSRHRHDRRDPRHYLNVHGETLTVIDNSFKVDIYLYELLTNRYKPSFINFHIGACEIMEKNPFFGPEVSRIEKLLNVTCPYPAGSYNITDIAIPNLPQHFPFTRGRIYLNVSKVLRHAVEPVLNAYVDLEIKQITVNKKAASK